MKKIKILVVLDALNCGGTEKYFLSLFDKIDKDRFIFFVAYSKEGNLLKEFTQRDICLFKMPAIDLKSFISNMQTCRLLQDFIKKNNIDILQTNFFASGLWSSIAAKRMKIPQIRTIWASFIDQSFGERLFIKKIFKKFYNDLADVFLCLFDSSREELFLKRLVKQEKVRLINLGIDINNFIPGKKDLSLIKEFDIKDGSPVVGMISNLHRVKRPDLFLQAIPWVKEKIENARFIIVGDGNLKDNLLKMAKRLDVIEETVFTGYRPDVDRLLRVFDVSVMPAEHQLGGVGILESLATGVPVVSSSCDGQKNLIKDGFNGKSFKPGDPKSLADAIVDVLEHKERLEQMKLNSRVFIENNFDFREHVGRIEKLYLGLTNK